MSDPSGRDRFELSIDDVAGRPIDGALRVRGSVLVPEGPDGPFLEVVDFYWNDVYQTSRQTPSFDVTLRQRKAHRHDFVGVVARLTDGQERSKVWFASASGGAAVAMLPTFDGPGGEAPEPLGGWDLVRDLAWPAALVAAAVWAGGEINDKVAPLPPGCCPQLVERLDDLDLEIKLVQLTDEGGSGGKGEKGDKGDKGDRGDRGDRGDESGSGWEVIDFETDVSPTPAQHGDVVGSVVGVPASPGGRRAGGRINVTGLNPGRSGNSARIFDSSRQSRRDPDLMSPTTDCETFRIDDPFANCTALGNVLVVAALDPRDGDSKDPRASLTLDFAGLGTTVTVYSIDFLDADARRPVVQLLDDGDQPIGRQQHVVPNTPNSGFVRWNLGPTSGVSKIQISLGGSGAVDNVVYRRDPAPR